MCGIKFIICINRKQGQAEQAVDSTLQSLLATMQPRTLGPGRYIHDTDWIPGHFSSLRMRTEMVLETLVSSAFNHLTWLAAQESFIASNSQSPTQNKLHSDSSSNGKLQPLNKICTSVYNHFTVLFVIMEKMWELLTHLYCVILCDLSFYTVLSTLLQLWQNNVYVQQQLLVN
jgi:hypothetical protein